MSGNDKNAHELPKCIDLPKLELTTSDSGSEDHVHSEARQGMKDFVDRSKSNTNDSTVTNLFGNCSLEENPGRQAAADAGIIARVGDGSPAQQNDRSLDLPSKRFEKAAEAGKEFETRARQALGEAHKDLKVTIDGSPAKLVEYQDKFQVTQQKTSLELAKEQLGAKANDEQLKAYAQQIVSINHRNHDDTTFKAGTTIRMPGQSADGGIYNKKSGITSTEWHDGTHLDVSEAGHGSAYTRNQAGDSVETTWDARTLGDNLVNVMADTRTVTVQASGEKTEKVFVPKGADGDGDFLTNRITTRDEKGRTFDLEFQPGKDRANKIVMTNADHSTVEFKPNAAGRYVSPDGKFGLGDSYQVYSRNHEADGGETRTFDNGNWERVNRMGQLVKSAGVDDWGRKAEYEFKPGAKVADTIKIETKDGRTVELHRQPKGGEYVGDNLDAGGNKIGTVGIGGDGRLIFKNDLEHTARTELKDGTTLEKKTNPDKTSTITFADGKTGFVTQFDNHGSKTTETYTGHDGRIFTKNFSHHGKQLDSVKLEGTDGSLTEMNFDVKAGIAKGHRVDKVGNVVETVSLQEDKLVFVDLKSGAVRAEKFVQPEGETGIPKFVPGAYDRDTGKFTYTNSDGLKTTESFAPGRTDVVKKDGTVAGETVTGDRSTLKTNGEATVLHADDSGVRLNANNTIDRWSSSDKDSAYGERLTPNEEKFVREHSDVDRRDIAEAHKRMVGDRTELDNFYKHLNTIDGAQHLSPSEKSALRSNIIHHVAYPAEIYQGRSPSCNVTVVQRDVATTRPDLYAKQIVQAVSEGSLTTADGTKVPLAPDNLKMQDGSGRDLASRIYQAAALSVELYPRVEFRNSEDGVGRLYPHPYNPAAKPVTFDGLNMAQIADARFKLTGEEKAIAMVDNLAELRTALSTNGGDPMIVGVDGSKAPFVKNGPVGGEGLNHVVTIVGLTKDHDPRAYVQNQWGLANDHSGLETALSANRLMDNMKMRFKQGDKTVSGPAIVLTGGDHTKGYEIVNGKLIPDAGLTATVKKGVSMVPNLK